MCYLKKKKSFHGKMIKKMAGRGHVRESTTSFVERTTFYTYEEFVIVTEAPQCNRMTATGQD